MTPHQFSQSDPLSLPVGVLAAPVDPIQVGASLEVAARTMTSEGVHALAVARGRVFIGLLDEAQLIEALSHGAQPHDPIDALIDPSPTTLPPQASGAHALRVFQETGARAIVIVDSVGEPVGMLTPSRLLQPATASYRPRAIGGMATPLGVYLTNGAVKGGASIWGLLLTGALMAGLIFVAHYLVLAVAVFILRLDMDSDTVQQGMNAATTVLFLVGLRMMPLSGTHAAEHMVVHAIERGERLRVDVVRRMPRSHPRCGTNIAVGAMIFMGILSSPWLIDEDKATLKLMVAVLATMFLWRPLGQFVQLAFTTKPPTDEQIESGIKAGEELLAASAVSSIASPPIHRKLAMSGIFAVIAGAMLTQAFLSGVLWLLQVPEAWRVF